MIMENGRPTKYKPEYDTEIVEYFEEDPFREITEVVEGKNWSKETIKEVSNKLPTFEAFASKIDVHVDTMIEWTKQHESFSESYKKAKQLQKDFLIQNGLRGLYPAAAFCFVAKNCTDMRDKQEIEHSGTVSIAQQIKAAYDKPAAE